MIEAVILTVLFSIASEGLVQMIKPIAAPMSSIPTGFWLLSFGVACVGFGFWLERRIHSSLSDSGTGVSIGVALTFVLRALSDDVPYFSSDLTLLIGLAVTNVVLIMSGYLLARRIQPRRAH